jgi:hypothetical protein
MPKPKDSPAYKVERWPLSRLRAYPWHTNIAAPGEPCGSIAHCAHCREAMAAITVERVLEAARAELDAADAKRTRMSA